MACLISSSRVRLRESGVDWYIRMVLRPGISIPLPASDTSELHLIIRYRYIYSLTVHRLYSRCYITYFSSATMNPGGNPGRPRREAHRDRDYEGVNAPLPPISTLLSNPSTSQSDRHQGDQRQGRQGRHHGGVNTPLPPISSLLSNSSTSQSDRDQGNQWQGRQGRHHAGVNTPLPPISTLLSNSSTSQSDRHQGDQGQRRHYEGVNPSLPAISTVVSGSSTSQLPLNQQAPRGSVRPSRVNRKQRHIYNDEQDAVILHYRDVRNYTWPQVKQVFENRCYEDGTKWEERSEAQLSTRYKQLTSAAENT